MMPSSNHIASAHLAKTSPAHQTQKALVARVALVAQDVRVALVTHMSQVVLIPD
jgi:hypothetical protein